MKLFRLFCVAACLATFPVPATLAQDCTDPNADLGVILYNTDFDVYQGCTKRGWVSFHDTGDFCPGSGLVGHWKFNETTGSTAADSSGSGNTGTLTNMDPNTDWVAGQIGGALDFDGSDDYVDAGSGSSLDDLSSFTYAAWIKPNSVGEGSKGHIITKGYRSTVELNVSNIFDFTVDFSGTDLIVEAPINTIQFGTWQHVVIAWDGSTSASGVKIYRNGIELPHGFGQNATGSRVSEASENLVIGNHLDGTRTFDGLLDDVRVYGRALSAAEIDGLYNGGAGCQ